MTAASNSEARKRHHPEPDPAAEVERLRDERDAAVAREAALRERLEDLADVGPLDHGLDCRSHYGHPCDCRWAAVEALLTEGAES